MLKARNVMFVLEGGIPLMDFHVTTTRNNELKNTQQKDIKKNKNTCNQCDLQDQSDCAIPRTHKKDFY